jgi:tetratricopeptide (TPR) repeat protein
MPAGTMNPLEDFDYEVACDDFLLYELGRLIEEDKASFDEQEFQIVIATGIYEHIERRLTVRSNIARRLRTQRGLRAGRLLHAVEDIEAQLRDFPEIIHSYTGYLFGRLEECAAIEPEARITAAADTLFEYTGDREAAKSAIEILGSNPSAVSARVLAHAISEPLLPEDLEAAAYAHVRSMWPLPRPYVLYQLKPHTHEDLPFRWFQLFIECDEASAVDRILEETIVHGDDPDFREDLFVLAELLAGARDPETEEKIMQVINSDETPGPAVDILVGFLKDTKTQRHEGAKPEAWAALDKAYAANRKYLAAARLFDSGRKEEAIRALGELLQEDPQYPFALMLKGFD